MIWLVLRMMMLKRIMKGMRKIGFSCMLANKLGNYPGNRPLITPIIPHPVRHIIRYNEDNNNADDHNDCESFIDFLILTG